MNLSPGSIMEFQNIFKDTYGMDLDPKQTRGGIDNRVGFFDLLLRIDQMQKKKKND